MKPADDACMDKVKEMYPRSRKSRKLKKKLTYPPDRYSNLFPNAYMNRHVHAEYFKRIELYSPFGKWHVFLYSIHAGESLFSNRTKANISFILFFRKKITFLAELWSCCEYHLTHKICQADIQLDLYYI